MTDPTAANQAPTSDSQAKPDDGPRWQPLSSVDRRVVGVLAEKAKTTPDSYPLSLNAVCSGSNQKSNRSPVMQLEPDDAEESLDRLREMGAVAIVQGYGRVSKYRHYLYDWLGVDKQEMAVITELILRGDQTVGELRGRAARMEPIAGLSELRPIIASLKSKGLVISLTPEGRGHVVTHALYQPRELERLKARYGSADVSTVDTASSGPAKPVAVTQPIPSAQATQQPATQQPVLQQPEAATGSVDSDIAEAFRRELAELRGQVAQMRSDLDDVTGQLRQTESQLQELKDALGA